MSVMNKNLHKKNRITENCKILGEQQLFQKTQDMWQFSRDFSRF